jgi:hypothetical protein
MAQNALFVVRIDCAKDINCRAKAFGGAYLAMR